MQPFKGPIVSNIEKIESDDKGREILTTKSGNQYVIYRDTDVDFLVDHIIIKPVDSLLAVRFPVARDLERDLAEREPIPRHLLEYAIYSFEKGKED